MSIYLINIIIVVGLLFLGIFFGSLAEKKHFKSILAREQELNRLAAASTRLPPEEKYQQVLVSGNVVVANDYFKYFVASLKGLFGGRLNTYESLLDRGRREAILRMKNNAAKMNAELVINVKLTTTNLTSQDAKDKGGAIEIFAYGTALVR